MGIFRVIYLFHPKMALSIMPYRVEDEGFRQQKFDFMVPPSLRRQGLQEHDDALGMAIISLVAGGLEARYQLT